MFVGRKYELGGRRLVLLRGGEALRTTGRRADGAHSHVPVARYEFTRNAPGWLIVGAIACLTHALALEAGFIWLDHAHLERGLALVHDGRWLAPLTQGFAGTGFYRPLVAWSLSLDAALGGSALLYHVTTLAWHVGASVLTCVAARVFGLSRRASILAGALFGAHPATSLVAGAIAFRSEAMMAVALLALIVLHTRRQAWGAACVLIFGSLTKETALVLAPLFIAVLELAAGPKGVGAPASAAAPPASDRAQRSMLLAAEAAAVAFALALRLAFAPRWRASFLNLPWDQALGTRLASLAKSASFAAVPFGVGTCDAFPVTPLASAPAIAGALLVGSLAYLGYLRRGPALLLALSLLGSLDLVPVMRFWSPHYLYVPLVFTAMLVAEAVDRWGRLARWGAGALIVGFGVLSLHEGARYRNDEAFWAREVEMSPACREGQFYLGEVARKQQRWKEAARRYELALAETPGILSYVDRLTALQNLGVVLLGEGRLAEAAERFSEALFVAPAGAERRGLVHNLATVAFRAGEPERVLRLLGPETGADDALPESVLLRARALHALGRDDEAHQLIERLRRGTGHR
jgi:tetratricopeptide (TPR) repeat protein